MNKAISLTLMTIISLSCNAGSYEEDRKELYRNYRRQEDREYIMRKEEGHQGIRPYANRLNDYSNNYDSALGYDSY